MRWIGLGFEAALISKGVAANKDIKVPIKWVIALPGSFILFNDIESAPLKTIIEYVTM
jgi:hypothetical protein